MGTSTKAQFTCFFRGAKGETGGKTFQEGSESTVKKLKQVGQGGDNISDIVNEPVLASEVRTFIAFDKIKLAQKQSK